MPRSRNGSSLPFSKRAHYLAKAAEIFEKRKMEIVDALQAEGGGWFGKGMFETGYTTEVFHAAAASTWQPIGEVLPSEYGKISTAVRRPMGVVSVISPWNFPCILSSRGFAFPLAAGNTIVLKPSGRDALLRRTGLRRSLRGSRRSRRACSTSSPVRAIMCRRSAMN